MKTKLLLLFAICFTAFGLNAQVNSVAIVGEAQGGWPGDNPENPANLDAHQMTSSDGVHWTYVAITLTNATAGGGIKFRANNAWDINWGSAAFPTGTGTQGGANILCIGGTYDVTFNSSTGEYHFEGPPIPVVELVGTAVSGGGSVVFTTTDAENYTASNVTLLAGTAQFMVDGGPGGTGGLTFPDGIATEPLDFIPVAAGTYSSITFNLTDGTYHFVAAPLIPSIAIVGGATPYGWPTGAPGEVDAGVLASTDGITYTGTVLLTTTPDNTLKFRQENAWANQWGGVTFPTGPDAAHLGDNIVVTVPGLYLVTLNRLTGAYSFAFATIAIVGDGVGGWPAGTPGEVDLNQMTTTDGDNYSLNGFTAVGGPAKFRQGNAWTLAWGGTDFPAGTGDTVGGSPNIPVVAGTYDITFNKTTGAYDFAPLATKGFSTSNFKVYPNPTNSNWNFSSVKENIQSIQIVDLLGKVVMTVNPNSTAANVDASALNAGIYFAKIATASATQTIKLMKN